jgi:hypothetical protein
MFGTEFLIVSTGFMFHQCAYVLSLYTYNSTVYENFMKTCLAVLYTFYVYRQDRLSELNMHSTG